MLAAITTAARVGGAWRGPTSNSVLMRKIFSGMLISYPSLSPKHIDSLVNGSQNLRVIVGVLWPRFSKKDLTKVVGDDRGHSRGLRGDARVHNVIDHGNKVNRIAHELSPAAVGGLLPKGKSLRNGSLWTGKNLST
jgi:hypothetical protein